MFELAKYINRYRQTLFEDVLPFWQEHSLDMVHGGYLTCLDRTGEVYDRDKFVWLQCRQVWLFSMLYNRCERRREWLDIALHGASFLQKFGRNDQDQWYFSLNQKGKPLTQPYNIFSDCFAAMAFAQLGLASENHEFSRIAQVTFRNILKRRENPKGIFNKQVSSTRPTKGFALPMILSNLVLEIEHLLDDEVIETVIDDALSEVMEVFYRPDLGVILENVGEDNNIVDSFEGRLVCPGHGLEAMWFIMDIGRRRQDQALIDRAKNIAIALLNFGWDKKYKGLFYFLDVKSHPPDKLEWDQKLWWVHQEAILAMVKGYVYTKDPDCLSWFRELDQYAFQHFTDPEFGEWFGYLNRRGEVLLPLKGGKWKGCFHTPRFLFQVWQSLLLI